MRLDPPIASIFWLPGKPPEKALSFPIAIVSLATLTWLSFPICIILHPSLLLLPRPMFTDKVAA
jgi:hypothetical protein